MEMASYEFDSVKVEKASAMRRYNRQRKVKLAVQLCAAFVVLLRSTTWLPAAVEKSGEFFRRFLSLFDCTFYVFVLVLAIVFVLHVSSGKNKAKPDLYEEFLQNSESGQRSGDGEKPLGPESPLHDKHIVCSENTASPVHDNLTVSTITKRTVSQVSSETVRAVSEKASHEKHYRRSKSEKFEVLTVKSSRRELQRSETEIRREIVRSGEEPARRSLSHSVEKLDNEEFNRRIAAFIAETKKVQKEETIQECLALTLRV